MLNGHSTEFSLEIFELINDLFYVCSQQGDT